MYIPKDILFEIWKMLDIITKRELAISCKWLSQKEEIKSFNIYIKQQISKVNVETFAVSGWYYDVKDIHWKDIYEPVYLANKQIAEYQYGTLADIYDNYSDEDYSGGDWVFIHYKGPILRLDRCRQADKVERYLKSKQISYQRLSTLRIRLVSKVDFVKEICWLYLYGCSL